MYIRGTSTTTTYSYFVVILQLYSYNIKSRNVITIYILFKYHKLQYISEQSANTLECQVYGKLFDTALHRISKRECALPSSTAQPRSLSPPTWWALTRFVDSIHCSKALRFWCKLLSAIFVRSFACVGSTQADGGTTTVSRVAPAVRAKKLPGLASRHTPGNSGSSRPARVQPDPSYSRAAGGVQVEREARKKLRILQRLKLRRCCVDEGLCRKGKRGDFHSDTRRPLFCFLFSATTASSKASGCRDEATLEQANSATVFSDRPGSSFSRGRRQALMRQPTWLAKKQKKIRIALRMV